jgi:DNA-binding NarL/FixJ family response regulator
LKRPRVARVLIVSDDRLLRDCVSERLEREEGLRMLPGCAGSELIPRLKTGKPDVILVDQDAVGASPESLLVRARAARPFAKILALASHATDAEAARALRYGATGVCDKAQGVASLLKAIAALLAGETWAGRRAISQALTEAVRERRSKPEMTLTAREREILSLLGGGYRNKELATLLRIKEQTVKVHLHSLFRKLNVRTRVEAALKAAPLA